MLRKVKWTNTSVALIVDLVLSSVCACNEDLEEMSISIKRKRDMCVRHAS